MKVSMDFQKTHQDPRVTYLKIVETGGGGHVTFLEEGEVQSIHNVSSL
jgi:hypothetical protein